MDSIEDITFDEYLSNKEALGIRHFGISKIPTVAGCEVSGSKKTNSMISDLDDFKTYNQAMKIGEEVWDVVMRWKFFERDTVGKQLVRAADSIAANLSEGLGRYHYPERKNFGYYSRGSLFETKTWLTKARNRRLVDEPKFNSLIAKLDIIGKMLNGYINSIGVQEPNANYGSDPAFPNA